MTVAIGNELSIAIGPAASPGIPGSSGSAGGLLPSAGHLPGKNAVGQEGGTGSGLAESFRARWQSELAAVRSADQADGGGGQMAAEDAGSVAGRETKSGDLPGFEGVNAQVGHRAAGANASMNASATRNWKHNSAIAGQVDAPSETGAGRSAESPASKDTHSTGETKEKVTPTVRRRPILKNMRLHSSR